MNSKFHNFRHQADTQQIKTLCVQGSQDEKDALVMLIQARTRADRAMRFVVDDVPQIKPIPELFRLPYEVCWFEYFVFFDGMASKKRRRHAELVWETETSIEVSSFLENSSGIWCFATHTSHCKPISADSDMGVWCRDLIPTESNFSDGFEMNYAQGTSQIIACILSAINCSNVSQKEVVPSSKLQNARKKKKKLPLYSFWTLRLSPSPEKRASAGGGHSSPRLHLRRGHARQYEPGKWCWVQAHVVGNKELGIVHKDYLYTTPNPRARVRV